MSRSFSSGSRNVLLVAMASLLLGLSWAAASASAATVQTGCAELQSTIDTAASHPNHGEGEVVVLNGMCEASNLKSTTGVTIPAESNVSIEGAAGTTSGFDGAGITAPLLHSAGSETVESTTLRNLTFQHANVTGSAGSALRLQAAHLTLVGDSFIENTTHGGSGGAVSVFVIEPGGSPTCPSSGGPAGVTVIGSAFRANKLVATSFAGGGALTISQICALPESILEGNVFEGNAIEYSGSGEALGGAFTFEPGGEKPTPLIQRGNVFDSNHIVDERDLRLRRWRRVDRRRQSDQHRRSLLQQHAARSRVGQVELGRRPRDHQHFLRADRNDRKHPSERGRGRQLDWGRQRRVGGRGHLRRLQPSPYSPQPPLAV